MSEAFTVQDQDNYTTQETLGFFGRSILMILPRGHLIRPCRGQGQDRLRLQRLYSTLHTLADADWLSLALPTILFAIPFCMSV